MAPNMEMTVKEAINIILRSVVHSVKSRENLSEALFIMQKALEKQIPKKYEVWNGQCSCPNCNVLFGNYDDFKLLKSWKMDYCKFCGQALDWGDSDSKDENDYKYLVDARIVKRCDKAFEILSTEQQGNSDKEDKNDR